MKRIYFFAIVAALGLLSMKPAQAVSELCPARFGAQPVRQGDVTSSSLFGFELSAEGPRTVSAMIAFDTNAGWFVASVPATTLQEKDRHYESPSATFVKRTWVSPIMYLQFPQPVHASNAWVYSAQATGDDFGWNKMGQVLCHPGAGTKLVTAPTDQYVKLDPKDADPLSSPPAAGATIIKPTRSA